MTDEPGDQACGTFLGIAIRQYDHFHEIESAVSQTERLAATLATFGYATLVVRNPASDELNSRVELWSRAWKDHGTHGPCVVAWSGHAESDHRNRLQLVTRDTTRGDAGRYYDANRLRQYAWSSGADQVLMVLDTCHSGTAVGEQIVDTIAEQRSLPPGRASGLLVIASCQPGEKADTAGLLIDALERVLRVGPNRAPSRPYRRAWSVHNPGVTAADVVDIVLDEWPDDAGQLPVQASTGKLLPIFRNPQWRPDTGAQLVEHLASAARGVAAREDGWFFTGRRRVLGEIVSWLAKDQPGVFVVTGPAGSGKSAVVGRIAALSDADERAALLAHRPLADDDPDPGLGSVDAVVHLRGLTVDQVAERAAHSLGLERPENYAGLIKDVARWHQVPGRESAPRLTLILDGLDEMTAVASAAFVRDLLGPLGRIARVLLSSRSEALRRHASFGAAGQHLTLAQSLTQRLSATVDVIDLADEPGTATDIARYATDRLSAIAVPGDQAAEVGRRLALHTGAGEGFLLARIVTSYLVAASVIADNPDWLADLPTSLAEAFDYDLAVPPPGTKPHHVGAARDLLTALAWGLGTGVPAGGVWEAIATALAASGRSYETDDVDWVLNHYGRYIVEDSDGDGPVYRLYHREFVRHLQVTTAGPNPALAVAHAVIGIATHETPVDSDRTHFARYLRTTLAAHAAAGGPAGVAALRTVAEAAPDAYLPDLAMALNNLANRLAEVGRRNEALAPAEEAVRIRRTLAETAPDAYLPNLATALNTLAIRLAEVGRRNEALAPAEEATTIYRTLAQAAPDAHLPNLAMALNTLAIRLAEVGRRNEALAPAEEATTIYRTLAQAAPDAHLPDLATALNNLANRLAEIGRRNEALAAYDDAITAFAMHPEATRKLLVDRAAFLLRSDEPAAGIRALIQFLTTEPSIASADAVLSARRLLRHAASNGGHRAAVTATWRKMLDDDPPTWLDINDSDVANVDAWLATRTWIASRDHLREHHSELVSERSRTVLVEYALVSQEAVRHLTILDAAAEHGIDAAYQPLIRGETTQEWLRTPDWQASHRYLDEHADILLTTDTVAYLDRLGERERPEPLLRVHASLLRLALYAGSDTAYQCVEDRKALHALIQQALRAADGPTLLAAAGIEAFVYADELAATVHALIGKAITSETGIDDGVPAVTELAARADTTDRERTASEIAALLTTHPQYAARVAPLLTALLPASSS
ncbi:tetratricopeptide repeat protein [Actinocrinis puniceicyclus]|uniref:Tetratricopeptide repeat protein n=1 Tax=Actinocrinis puniceicyclus TaxID=977794 RepID=A0A8J8BEW8_9ACTN|nr:tetratricopeptide repeat protein [Actinocrinis puniceicyclus]MBS2966025.1 tetratricopeptide repeat protein [Actinocrinis puniceicyclus]